MPNQEALGLLLLQEGLITESQLYEAMGRQRHHNRPLVTCLLHLGCIGADQLLAAQSRLLDLPALSGAVLMDAAPEALQRVPAAVATRLHIVPFSWDGEVLGVALSESETLGHLDEVAELAQAAIGAYIALPGDIDAALVQLYAPEPTGKVPNKVIRGLPPVAAKATVLTRVSFYDATAQIHEAPTVQGVGELIGAALLNYFNRVLVFLSDANQVRLCAVAGASPGRKLVVFAEVPQLRPLPGQPLFYYGKAAAAPGVLALAQALSLPIAATAMLAFVGPQNAPNLLFYADNGDVPDLYDDLHDIEMLLKEATTALRRF